MVRKDTDWGCRKVTPSPSPLVDWVLHIWITQSDASSVRPSSIIKVSTGSGQYVAILSGPMWVGSDTGLHVLIWDDGIWERKYNGKVVYIFVLFFTLVIPCQIRRSVACRQSKSNPMLVTLLLWYCYSRSIQKQKY